MHCSVAHWGSLTHQNTVSAMGWVKQFQDLGEDEYLRVVLEMLAGGRPTERGTLVVAGAMFPTNLKLRSWLLLRLKKADAAMRVAATYALAAHLDQDDSLAERLLVLALKTPKDPGHVALHRAIQDVLSIWRSSHGSGTCDSCAPAREGKTDGLV